jgi:N,N'-diacetyllegionaminate synthase
MREIKIGNKKIGQKNPCYTIAEAGANHEGDLKKAFKLIDAAVFAKADSIKFQTYTASKLVTKTAPKYWDDGIKGETQFDVFSKLDTLKKSDWQEIFNYAEKKEITCFSTPFDEDSVELLYSLGVEAFKIASADITHIPLIKKIASKGIPIFMSTGMASDEDIMDAVQTIKNQGNENIILMHCMTSYPTPIENANLEMIKTMTEKFSDCVIGYSDHTIGIDIPVFSSLYGSKCIEKHFTFDTKLTTSRDHRLSLNQDEFRQMVEKLQLVEKSKGNKERKCFEIESDAVKFARRSIVSRGKIPKGTILTRELLDIKRPGTGIAPKHIDEIIGKKTLKDIDEDVPIQENDLTN